MTESFAKMRKLLGTPQCIIDSKNIAENVTIFNPSKSGEWTYMRKTITRDQSQLNAIIMYNENTKSLHNIDPPLDMMPKTFNYYMGLEDLRICIFEDRIWFGATSMHASSNMMSEIVVGYFNKDVTAVEKIQMMDVGALPAKNVLPFVHKGMLLFIDVLMRKVYALKTDTEAKWFFETFVELKPGAGIVDKDLRGSTSPIHLHGPIYGCVAHKGIINDSKFARSHLSYMHYWYEFDITTGLITFISSPFWILLWGTEYVSGIFKHPNGAISLYLGVNDKTPYVVLTTLNNLRVL
jgi:hypothetical protein